MGLAIRPLPFYQSSSGFGLLIKPEIYLENRYYLFNKKPHTGLFLFQQSAFSKDVFVFNRGVSEFVGSGPNLQIASLGLGYRGNLGKRFYYETQLGYGLYYANNYYYPMAKLQLNLGFRF